jgi:class 3 adenylate cyclase
VVSYRGQIIKNTGDGFLATFDSSVDALRCAIDVQRDVTANESPKSPDRRIRLRMALNFGDVISDLGDVYGTHVNVAARLEQFAQPGGIIVSDALLEIVKTRMDVPVQDLGQLELKNISRRVRAYSLRVPGLESGSALANTAASPREATIPSIAILPFRTSDDNLDNAYFSEGMVDDIIFLLSSIRGLLVISRT